MAEDYSRCVARVVVAQMAELTGFEAAQESAVEVLAELLIKYLQEVCTAAHSYAEMAHRTDFNICDLNLSLSDMGTSMDDLKKYLDSWLAEQVSLRCVHPWGRQRVVTPRV
jgi:transcription initiation factor TFIID subunit 8